MIRIANLLEDDESSTLSRAIRIAIAKEDPNLSIMDLGTSIGEIIREDYGVHNLSKFLDQVKLESSKSDV